MPDDPDSKNPFRSPDAPEPEPPVSKQDKFFSTDHEPALQGGDFAVDPSEQRAAGTGQPPEEHEALRDSIAMEPALPQHSDPQPWRDWLQKKRAGCTRSGNLAVTLTAALLGGPLAIVGAFALGMQGYAQAVYMVVFGPVIEELLKQSGMVYLLEKKPYRLFAPWQFVFAGAVSGLAFATIENLLYIHVTFRLAGVQNVADAAAFRWIVCTALHTTCSIIASLGLLRVWRRQVETGTPADLSYAYPMFALAMAVHGFYNLVAMFITFH